MSNNINSGWIEMISNQSLVNSQQSTVLSQQSSVNSQQSTVNKHKECNQNRYNN
ncbi:MULTISPECIES: hypothetical protein [unclassified Microcoleus]|uniref:hypothetical protein n=1 Tax=unclassified Microcoleus TaxID=2642155 RepID=UPI002FD0FFAA